MEAQTMTQDDGDLSQLLASLTMTEAQEEPTPVNQTEVVAITNVKPSKAPTEEDLEAELLADLAGIATTPSVTTNEILDDALLADLESTTARAEVYASQESSAVVADPTAAAPAKAARKPRAAKAASAGVPRVKRVDLNALPNDVFQLRDGDAIDDTAKAVTLSKRPAQVKVAEKFDNLFQSIAANKLPSRYVVTAINLLSKNGSMTSADLNAAFIGEGLGKGTASSQTGQIVALFSAVGIANRSGQSLTACQDSAVAKKLKAIIAGA